MKLNLRQVEVFRAVMITGSIRGASELLFVSQPAVSRLLSHMEQVIGFALFARIRGRLHATPEAKKLYHKVDEVYEKMQRLNELTKELKEHQEGILNVVASPSLGQMLIPTAIFRYRQKHPEVQLGFHYLTHLPLTERLLKQQADLAVTILPLNHPNLFQEEIGIGKIVCICPYNHPLSRRAMLNIEDLIPYPFISYDQHTPFGKIVELFFQGQEKSPKTVLKVGSPQNACALVQAGAGISLVDQFSAQSWATNRFVTRPIVGAPALNIYLIYLRDEPLSQLTQSFVETLKTLISEEGYKDIPK